MLGFSLYYLLYNFTKISGLKRKMEEKILLQTAKYKNYKTLMVSKLFGTEKE